ncbi:hypothetical protein ABT263_34905 [Kitasatospora sp. NPDC001603]|uniref:hypothetical protein n=1 Tax=Kitasatospora sp. NPDC001603 TaxID=3154388 RepID=UPI003321F3E5
MKTRIRWKIVIACLAAVLAIGASTVASADSTPAGNSAAPPVIEDFTYPGASPFPNLKLLRGDGNIVLADCYTDVQIQLFSRAVDGAGPAACFRVTGTTGFLALELPKTFIIRTAGYDVRARLTTDAGVTTTVDVPKDTQQNVAEGLGQKPAALVELRTS